LFRRRKDVDKLVAHGHPSNLFSEAIDILVVPAWDRQYGVAVPHGDDALLDCGVVALPVGVSSDFLRVRQANDGQQGMVGRRDVSGRLTAESMHGTRCFKIRANRK